MKTARAVGSIAVAAVLVALAAPEIPRYAAECNLRSAEAALDFVIGRSGEVRNPVEVLGRISERSVEAAHRLPSDSRGWVLAGSARLLAGDAERALAYYREALTRGERAEIHLNLGRAEARAGRDAAALAAFVRAVWISPFLIRAVPQNFVEPVRRELARLEAELAAGRLAAPPPPPG